MFCVSVSPYLTHNKTGGYDDTLYMGDKRSPDAPATVASNIDSLMCIAMNPAATSALLASCDGTLRVFDVRQRNVSTFSTLADTEAWSLCVPAAVVATSCDVVLLMRCLCYAVDMCSEYLFVVASFFLHCARGHRYVQWDANKVIASYRDGSIRVRTRVAFSFRVCLRSMLFGLFMCCLIAVCCLFVCCVFGLGAVDIRFVGQGDKCNSRRVRHSVLVPSGRVRFLLFTCFVVCLSWRIL